jgi:uncharacterized protein (DUF488 family)
MKDPVPEKSGPILTVGHSTHTLDDFIHLLHVHEVDEVIDVRTVPRSRHNPQFNRDTLPDGLRSSGIAYLHMPGLGGLRHPQPDSPNLGWRNSSFRGFADYMQTEEFEKQLKEVIEESKKGRVALMCAEAVPWRCHRSLIADALQARNVAVEHVLSSARRRPHRLTPFARVMGTRVIYPLPPSPDRGHSD